MAKEGIRVPAEYGADALSQRLVKDAMTKSLVMLQLSQTVGDVRQWFESGAKGASHQGYPVVDERGEVAGVVTRRDIADPRKPARTAVKDLIRRPPVLVYDDCSLAEAADHMLNHEIGRLPVTNRREPLRVIGILTRGDLLRAQRERPIRPRS
jgi:chloride channel protein, CIC family